MGSKDSLKTGTLEMLILKILSEEDCYAYQLVQVIEKLTEGIITVPMGSMYPRIYALEKKGYISESNVKKVSRTERQYYHLEKEGEEELKRLLDNYYKTVDATEKVLSYTATTKEKIEKDVI